MPLFGLEKTEQRAVLALASIFGLRLFGLFALLPVMSLATQNYLGATPGAMGLALGIYGLTQGIFQLPFGFLSDRFPRHWVISVGLLLFIAGSLVAMSATTIQGLILGRALQGAGAVGGSLLALIADLTRVEVRHRAMALVGMMVGMAFILAMVFAPVLFALKGLSLIFGIMAGLGSLAIMLLFSVVPRPDFQQRLPTTLKEQCTALFSDNILLNLTYTTLLLHAILTLLFMALPRLLLSHWQLSGNAVSFFYAGALGLMLIGFLPWMMKLDRTRRQNKTIRQAALCMGIAIGGMILQPAAWLVLGLLGLFFVGFNILETVLPAATSQQARQSDKGAALGLFSTAQFLGTFLGGSLGGFVLSIAHEQAVLSLALFSVCILYALALWVKE